MDPSSGEVTRAADREASPQVTIGPYLLLQRVGEGGMGEVWQAEQAAPIRRKVAVKVIKAGMDTAHVVARFEAERQALAMMDHPAIARVFDAGATPQGRPYFVMEYVRGEAVTAYCNRHRLSTRDRLQLFLQICDGVQHAHQKGIIHRDLKPSNILITLVDGRPVPKIIDFGVAKAIAQPLTDRPLYTEVDTLIGTPEYMSPEQAEMTGLDIDTRTDVYALGVILYELLTGVLPFDSRWLREQTLAQIRRTIREVEPARPSNRLTKPPSTPGEGQRADAAQAVHELRGDLDWITMRALEKDRTRRYGSAAELAADLRRHLEHLPVLAGPPRLSYRVGKFVRRHRAGVSVAGLLLAVLIAFAATTAVQAVRISRERDRANREADIANAVSTFLQNDLLAQAGASAQAQPDITPDRDLRVRTALDRAAARIEGKFAGEPLIEAAIRHTIGTTYEDLGSYVEAQPHLERALQIRRRVLGSDDPNTIRSTWQLASLKIRREHYDEAERLYRQTVDTQLRVLGPDHPDRLAAMQDLGWLMSVRGQHQAGEQLVAQALAKERELLGDDHPNTLRGISRLANVMMNQGRYADQEKLAREGWDRRRRLDGPDHPGSLGAQRVLAVSLSRQRRLDESEALLRDVLDRTRRVLGPSHPSTASILNDLGLVLRRSKRPDEAAVLFRDAVDIWERALGPGNRSALLGMNNLGLVYLDARRNIEGERLYADLLDKTRQAEGAEHPRTVMVMNNLGLIRAHLGRYADAERVLRDAISIARRSLGEKHPTTANAVLTLAETMALRGNRTEAMALVEDAVSRGYDDGEQIAADEDLKSLRADPRFEAVVTKLRAGAKSSSTK